MNRVPIVVSALLLLGFNMAARPAFAQVASKIGSAAAASSESGAAGTGAAPVSVGATNLGLKANAVPALAPSVITPSAAAAPAPDGVVMPKPTQDVVPAEAPSAEETPTPLPAEPNTGATSSIGKLKESAGNVHESAKMGEEAKALTRAYDGAASHSPSAASIDTAAPATGRRSARLTLRKSRPADAANGKKVILVTGFEAFDGASQNVSADAARRLDGSMLEVFTSAAALLPEASFQVVSLVLPVSYERSAHAVIEAIQRLTPSAVLMMGLSGRTPSVEVERLARNRMDQPGYPDADGRVYEGTPIAPKAPEVLTTGVPVNDLVGDLSKAGYPATASEDAGGYVCNSAYYCAMLAAKLAGETLSPVFLHLPPAGEHLSPADRQALPHWPLESIFAAVEHAARWMAVRATS